MIDIEGTDMGFSAQGVRKIRKVFDSLRKTD